MTVTGTCGGLAATSVTPGGKVALDHDVARAQTDRGDIQIPGERRADDPIEVGGAAPDRQEESIEADVVRVVGPRLDEPDPDLEAAGRGHGTISGIVTFTWSTAEMMPSGRARFASTVCDSEKPPTAIGCVSTLASGWRSSASPSTVTIRASTVTEATPNPAAGEPVTCGLTGKVFDWRFEKTGS